MLPNLTTVQNIRDKVCGPCNDDDVNIYTLPSPIGWICFLSKFSCKRSRRNKGGGWRRGRRVTCGVEASCNLHKMHLRHLCPVAIARPGADNFCCKKQQEQQYNCVICSDEMVFWSWQIWSDVHSLSERGQRSFPHLPLPVHWINYSTNQVEEQHFIQISRPNQNIIFCILLLLK